METPRKTLRKLHSDQVENFSTPLKIPASPFMKSLGYGTGVCVYRLDRSPGNNGCARSPWAVKRVSKHIDNERAAVFNNRIQKEAETLRKLQHPHIVGFRGIVKATEAGGLDNLALECCKTSLGTILEERYEEQLGSLPAENCLKMILDISNALDYLHTEAKLLHGDLKSFNILIKGQFEICKLCDFGVSLPLDGNGEIDFKKNPGLNFVGTPCWSAPEVIDEKDVIDYKADMFSFGMVIYETIALVPPHTLNLTADDHVSLDTTTEQDSEEFIEEMNEVPYGTRPPLPNTFDLTTDYNPIVECFYCCTNELPEDRPTAKDIWKSLQPKQEEEKENEKSGD